MTDVDRTVASIGLPRHDKPREIAGYLRAVARLLDTVDLDQAIRIAPLLAARGWPTGTLGGGGGHSGSSMLVVDENDPDDPTSPEGERVPATGTELAALGHGRFHDADRRLATLLAEIQHLARRDLARLAQQAAGLGADLLAHADDVDEIPAGTGSCEACDHFCNPRKDPNDRLKAKLCPACWTDWGRKKGQLDYDEWLLVRRQVKGHTEGAAGLQARLGRSMHLHVVPDGPESA